MPKVKKQKTVLRKTPLVKPQRSVKQQHKPHTQPPKAPRASAAVKCSSVIDQQSAEAVAKLLAAAETRTSGATIKSLTLAPHIVHKKPTFAVTCETLKHLPLLKQLLAEVGLLEQGHGQLAPATAYVLTYELLFGQGFRTRGPAEKAILARQDQLHSALQSLLQQGGVSDAAAWLNKQQQQQQTDQPHQQQQQPVQHPRYARVNTLKATVADVLQQLQHEYGSAGGSAAAVSPAAAAAAQDSHGTSNSSKKHKKQGLQASAQHPQQQQPAVHIDDLLPDVIVLPAGTDLHDHPLVQQGVLILQSKASCMPAHALSPDAGWHVVDCCAAPGNKTTHVAALLHAGASTKQAGKQASSKKRSREDDASVKVFAFDKDPKRLKRLQANVERTGAGDIVTATQGDFLSIDPTAPQFAKAQGVILDPSCSGSGTIISRMDHLLPKSAALDNEQAQQDQEQQRIEQLAKFQEAAILHALKFPALKRLVYSTCSVHQRENEDVVDRVLPVAKELGFKLVDPFPSWHRRGLAVVEGNEKLVRTDPYLDGTDGFFVAVFAR